MSSYQGFVSESFSSKPEPTGHSYLGFVSEAFKPSPEPAAARALPQGHSYLGFVSSWLKPAPEPCASRAPRPDPVPRRRQPQESLSVKHALAWAASLF